MTVLCGIEVFACIVDKNKNVYIYSSELEYNNLLIESLSNNKIKNFFTKYDVRHY